jgi:hypothetical protein
VDNTGPEALFGGTQDELNAYAIHLGVSLEKLKTVLFLLKSNVTFPRRRQSRPSFVSAPPPNALLGNGSGT